MLPWPQILFPAMPDPTAKKLAGVLPVFQTPYRDDDAIDFDTLSRELNWLFEQGADGIVMAMVSEVLRLSAAERMELAAHACKFAQRGVVVISVGAESSKTAAEFARHAESLGADALMAIPPVATAVGEAELLKYFERILRACALPLVVQDASGYVGRPMSIEMQAKLLAEWGADRVLFKPEAPPIGPRLSQLRDATGGKAKIFEGTGGIALVDSFRRGIVGTMPGADLIRGIVALWRALNAGNDARVYELSLPISSLVAIQSSLDAFLAVEKYLLVKQGIFKNTLVRGPVGYSLDDETRREVDRLFELLNHALGAGDSTKATPM
jgi:dihydrodipicolinate synthase/N-acetylneuraminate lyase